MDIRINRILVSLEENHSTLLRHGVSNSMISVLMWSKMKPFLYATLLEVSFEFQRFLGSKFFALGSVMTREIGVH